jgi:hypothetical protein
LNKLIIERLLIDQTAPNGQAICTGFNIIGFMGLQTQPCILAQKSSKLLPKTANIYKMWITNWNYKLKQKPTHWAGFAIGSLITSLLRPTFVIRSLPPKSSGSGVIWNVYPGKGSQKVYPVIDLFSTCEKWCKKILAQMKT